MTAPAEPARPGPGCYHLCLAPGELAPYVLTSGSPERIRRLAGWFDTIRLERRNREFLTLTGDYQGVPVSALATGIGPDNTAIALIEAAGVQPRATFIRVGSCGSLQPGIRLGDLIISSRALRRDAVTPFYAGPEVEAVAHPEVTAALEAAAREAGYPCHVGLTCTTNDFYHAQGRRAPGFPGFDPDLLPRLQAQGVLNLEMEMAVYLTLARVSRYPLRAGGLTAVYADRCREIVASPEDMAAAEERACRTALAAVVRLAAAAQTRQSRAGG